ncbi:MAG TPA: acyl-CoA dehydrogenase family protein [Vicinamibacterales bacterium]|nr:acyl-CoA dehydrogenase family protein [Vicinamibacterales bacterium]
MSAPGAVRGASWLFASAAPVSTFTPEQLSDEHRLIRQTADAFMANEVLPAIHRLEEKDWTCARELVATCAELGLLGTDVPEEYGGLAMDKVSSLIVGEAVGRLPSFATTFGAQTGLSITPLLCFGTSAQKQQYLPRLVSGEILGAYALSESGSGSDALSARARAVRQADGSFVLSGEKMWITNGGFADIFIVFANVEDARRPDLQVGRAFTAFIVERAFPGVASGNEEHKMGLNGSSTTPLILQDVRVPAENVLGEVGKGHKVAFNVLNYGRVKLGAMCSGGARFVIAEAAKYASERRQFGRPIAEFGAIRHKLSEMVVREYAVESMLYRLAGLLDGHDDDTRSAPPSGLPDTRSAALSGLPAALEAYAIEASIVKVAGSEMLDYVVDENVQIHGGNGFVRDYPAERHYRDARVNRIFEGTNEINRLLIAGMLVRRSKAMLVDGPEPQDRPDAPDVMAALDTMKAAALTVLATAVSRYGDKLGDEQEVLTLAADILIDVFASDSVTARAAAAGDPLHAAVASVYVSDAAARVEVAARTALAAMLDGDERATAVARIRRLFDIPAVDTVPLRNLIAAAVLSRGKYPYL